MFEKEKLASVGAYTALGAIIGLVIGVFLESVPLWLGIGIVLGFIVGVVFTSRK